MLNMGEPILIKDLAEKMIMLSGKKINQDVKIEYIGLRPGEKLYEELFHESEQLRGTSHPKLLLARSRQVDWSWLLNQIEQLENAADSRDVGVMVSRLKTLVPEYSDGEAVRDKKASAHAALKVLGN